MDDGTVETILMILFTLAVIVFVTLGAVLLTFFLLRRIPKTQRALLATVLVDVVLGVPITLLSGEGVVVLVGLSVMVGVVGFPTAFLATRKLDRIKQAGESVAAVFE